MTNKVDCKGNNRTDISVFGGLLDIEDFSTQTPNKKRIGNQADADRLPETIARKAEQRKEEEEYRKMTLEELREKKLISNTNGRPSASLTDKKWQKEFRIRKLFLTPYGKEVKKLGGKYSKESGSWNEETRGAYYGRTNWQEYCAYINDVLGNIRAGQRDYCYFIYQIMELARFHKDTLKTKYCNGYWEVWLEEKRQSVRD